MAISKIQKVNIISHSDHIRNILSKLKDLGIVEIIIKTLPEKTRELHTVETKLEKLNLILSFLRERYKKFKTSYELDESTIKHVITTYEPLHISDKCLYIDKKEQELKNSISTLMKNIDLLSEWKDCPYELDLQFITSKVLFCEVNIKSYQIIISNIKSEPVELLWEKKKEKKIMFVLLIPNDIQEKITTHLKTNDVTIYDFSSFHGKAKDRYDELIDQLSSYKTGLKRLTTEVDRIKEDDWKIKLLYDYYTDLYEELSIENSLAKTDKTIFIEGWIQEKKIAELRRQILNLSKEIVILVREPLITEEPPVIYENFKFIKPFEFITTLYGRPNYHEPDPTPILAPFFLTFFALCISDAFYGLILCIFSIFLLKKYKLDEETTKLLKMLLICSVGVFIFGIFANSFAGAGFLKFIPMIIGLNIIDPLKETMKLLFICFGFGIIHIITGLIISIIKQLKERKILEAILSFCWIFTIVSVAVLIYSEIFGMPVEKKFLEFSNKSALVGFLFIYITTAIKTKSIFMKPFAGLIKMYSIVGYLGDVLSYARLLALCLTGLIIAQVINFIVNEINKMGYIGPVLAILVFIGGHCFNFILCCLGAFVHTTRLQYVEFFQKFYTGDGKPFVGFKRHLTLLSGV